VPAGGRAAVVSPDGAILRIQAQRCL
jgi:hypothetical protein